MNDPIAVLLKFAFIGVLYLFLLWIARSAMKDLRRAGPELPAEIDPPAPARPVAPPTLIAVTGGGFQPGLSFALDGVTTIGRSPRADITIEDSFASGNHA